jgi:hypothetical protein
MAAAANGRFEPTLPFFCIAAKVGFRETGKITSDTNGPKPTFVVLPPKHLDQSQVSGDLSCNVTSGNRLRFDFHP